MADNSEPAGIQTGAPTSAAEVSDLELVARVQAGDEDSFEQLFNRHKRRVAHIAGRFFRQREQVEEIMQESFTKAYFALSDFANQQENSFASWIARIAFNACYDELRRQKRRPESSLNELTEEDSAWLKEQLLADTSRQDIESEAVKRDLADKLLARLSPEDRLVLVMLDVEGMSVSDIAKSTRWSVSKFKVRAHRARASLRRVLSRFM